MVNMCTEGKKKFKLSLSSLFDAQLVSLIFIENRKYPCMKFSCLLGLKSGSEVMPSALEVFKVY